MTSLHTAETAPMTAEDLLRERRKEWAQFTRFTAYGAAGVVALLLLMRVFLV